MTSAGAGPRGSPEKPNRKMSDEGGDRPDSGCNGRGKVRRESKISKQLNLTDHLTMFTVLHLFSMILPNVRSKLNIHSKLNVHILISQTEKFRCQWVRLFA